MPILFVLAEIRSSIACCEVVGGEITSEFFSLRNVCITMGVDHGNREI